MVEIKAGPELDRAVAEAIDLHLHIATGSRGTPGEGISECGRFELLWTRETVTEYLRWDDPRFPAKRIPKYSTDLNAAFAAAEKVGLFGGPYYCTLCKGPDHWIVGGHYIATDSTAALVICAAILKLREAR